MTETQGYADTHLPSARVRTTDGTRADVDRVRFERFLDPDDPVDLQAVVERFLPLARGCAARYAGRGEPFDDVFQVACVALLKAIRRYDVTRAGAFSSYAVPTIVGEIKRYFRDRTWSVRPPRDLLELTLAVAGAYRGLEHELSREPTVGEIADRLHRSDADVLHALQARHARQALSLEAPHGAGDGPKGTLGDLVGVDEQGFARVDARVELGALTHVLKQRDRLVLYLRFGEDLTQKAIGERIGISQMQVSRILRSSIRRLGDHAEQSQWLDIGEKGGTARAAEPGGEPVEQQRVDRARASREADDARALAPLAASAVSLADIGPGPWSLEAALGGQESGGAGWALAALGSGAIGSMLAIAGGRRHAAATSRHQHRRSTRGPRRPRGWRTKPSMSSWPVRGRAVGRRPNRGRRQSPRSSPSSSGGECPFCGCLPTPARFERRPCSLARDWKPAPDDVRRKPPPHEPSAHRLHRRSGERARCRCT